MTKVQYLRTNPNKVLEPFSPFKDFRTAAQGILRVLHQRVSFGLWIVTRMNDNDSGRALAVENHDYNIKAGDVFRWSDSICYRMSCGLGPNIAPRVDKIPGYASAPIGKQLAIGAYIGIPLTNADGKLYGTLCAIDPKAQPETINQHKEFIFLQARLLSTLIRMEHEEENISMELVREKRKSQIDELTGVYNRRGWGNFLAIEEERCQRYGTSASIVIVDLDELKHINDTKGHAEGDVLIQKTADCLRSVVRPFDIIARIGGDEFALLIVESSEQLMLQLIKRIRIKLKSEKVLASIGWAAREGSGVNYDVQQLTESKNHNNTLNEVMQLADERMYQDKQKHKTTRKKKKKRKAG